MLSTTRRFPANDCAMRLASSRSFADGAEPFSSMESSVTFTETLELLRVGSLRNAVWMSLWTWLLPELDVPGEACELVLLVEPIEL